MKRLYLLGLMAGLSLQSVAAEPRSPLLDDKPAFIASLIEKMTLEEKVGQLRLISIGGDMPRERILDELAAGHIGGTFNTVTRHDNRPMQEAALRSRMKIPIFFAYDVIHGHRTIFPIGLGLASSWDLDTIATSGRVQAIEASA
ncbi:MAG TPA: beta-glucosidase, partial [Pseudomonas sp.]|nr:beta-glucosidase [Pseudomonas sp.]